MKNRINAAEKRKQQYKDELQMKVRNNKSALSQQRMSQTPLAGQRVLDINQQILKKNEVSLAGVDDQ